MLTYDALQRARLQAQQVMKQQMSLYNPTITYDGYGKQIVASGVAVTVSGYIGNISGTDRELVSDALAGISKRDGVEVRRVATILLPHTIQVDDTSVFHVKGVQYNTIWANNDLMSGVKVYTKVIVVHLERRDESINYNA